MSIVVAEAGAWTDTELLIATLARALDGARMAVVGANQPIPAAAGLLAEIRAGGALRVAILGSTSHFPFPDGGREVFDLAGQGRIDVFFLGGGQIDGAGNVNLVGAGAYPEADVRFPGSYGSAYLYYTVPRVILFRREHSPRVLVPKVDFVSAPGRSDPGTYRRGGPAALITGKAVMAFDREAGGFALESIHPGETVDGVRAATGFTLAAPDPVAVTEAPSAADIALIRGPVREALAPIYPAFTRQTATG